MALSMHASAWFIAASTTLPALPLQPLPDAFWRFSVLPALDLPDQPLAEAGPLGTASPPAPIKLAIPMPASNFFSSFLFMIAPFLSSNDSYRVIRLERNDLSNLLCHSRNGCQPKRALFSDGDRRSGRKKFLMHEGAPGISVCCTNKECS